ncbi:hypothetical protein J2128_000128 [Methanomicrobium sp. W14]|nr:hypothetical protein [Methanomicrobium sp. W14]
MPFDDPSYGEEKEEYIKNYDSVLYERLRG